MKSGKQTTTSSACDGGNPFKVRNDSEELVNDFMSAAAHGNVGRSEITKVETESVRVPRIQIRSNTGPHTPVRSCMGPAALRRRANLQMSRHPYKKTNKTRHRCKGKPQTLRDDLMTKQHGRTVYGGKDLVSSQH